MLLSFRSFDFGLLGLDSWFGIPGWGFLLWDFVSVISVFWSPCFAFHDAGSWFWIHRSGFVVLDCCFWIPCFGFIVLESVFGLSCFVFLVLDSQFCIPVFGVLVLNQLFWIPCLGSLFSFHYIGFLFRKSLFWSPGFWIHCLGFFVLDLSFGILCVRILDLDSYLLDSWSVIPGSGFLVLNSWFGCPVVDF